MKKILYTGARSGLAKNVIDKLSDEYLIYLTVENDNQLKQIAKIYKDNKNIKYFKLNMLDDNDLKLVENLEIDILVSNAAVGYGGSIATIDINKLKENFDVNVFNNIKLIQLVLKQMIKRNSGRVIIMSSLAGIIPIPFLGSYCATKASLIKLSQCLRAELKYITTNVDIVLITPGMYHTGFNQVMLENKYNYLKNSYFKNEIELIRKKETLFFNLFEHNNYNSITNKIYKAITVNNPKKVYAAPYFQVMFAKIFELLN